MARVGSEGSQGEARVGWKRRPACGRSLRGLCLVLVLLMLVVGGLSACGDEDISLPGEISYPPIPPEATETPDDG